MHSFLLIPYRIISARAWDTRQEVFLRGEGGGKEESVPREKRLRSRRANLEGIRCGNALIAIRSSSQGEIPFSASHVFMASFRMLSNDRWGCLGARSIVCRGNCCWAKKEISDGFHALRFVESVDSFSLCRLLVTIDCSLVLLSWSIDTTSTESEKRTALCSLAMVSVFSLSFYCTCRSNLGSVRGLFYDFDYYYFVLRIPALSVCLFRNQQNRNVWNQRFGLRFQHIPSI